jgi:hypothetical protein
MKVEAVTSRSDQWETWEEGELNDYVKLTSLCSSAINNVSASKAVLGRQAISEKEVDKVLAFPTDRGIRQASSAAMNGDKLLMYPMEPRKDQARFAGTSCVHSTLNSLGHLTTQAQRPGARDATIATATLPPGSLQRMVRPRRHHQNLHQGLLSVFGESEDAESG